MIKSGGTVVNMHSEIVEGCMSVCGIDITKT